jgi:hypothetical protein
VTGSGADGLLPIADKVMNKYATAAVDAARLCARSPGLSPADAWEDAPARVFQKGSPAQKKGCPRGAFLGLCAAGMVRGVPAGEYTRSEANRAYAERAVEARDREPGLAGDVNALWERVMAGEEKRHNCQMDVVVALWREGLLAQQPA